MLGYAAMRLLAGDVGGTKVLLQYLEGADRGQHRVLLERRYQSALYPTFERLLTEFVALGVEKIDSACFAVAGPVIQDVAEITNLSWRMDCGKLQTEFGIPRVSLINDFYAVALGVPLLGEKDLVSLNRGRRDRTAPIGVLGAGTGLGEAFVIPEGSQWRVVPTEGGHADFAPRGAEQRELMAALEARYGHVSYERIVSGMGLVNIYTWLRDRSAGEAPTKSVESAGEVESLPARIAAGAREGDALARNTFDMFIDVYGAEAGNMALRLLARGGIFLAGGIAAKNVEHFTDGRFMRAFCHKGRFAAMLREISVDVIVNANVGLIGAASMAARAQ